MFKLYAQNKKTKELVVSLEEIPNTSYIIKKVTGEHIKTISKKEFNEDYLYLSRKEFIELFGTKFLSESMYLPTELDIIFPYIPYYYIKKLSITGDESVSKDDLSGIVYDLNIHFEKSIAEGEK